MRGWTYNAVSNTYFNDEKVRAWPEDARWLGLYLLTNEQRSAEGFYGLPLGLACDDLAWSRERLLAALAEVQAIGFASYDETARVVLIHKALKYHPPKGRPSIMGALKAVVAVKGTPALFDQFVTAADKYAPDFAHAIRVHYELPAGGMAGGIGSPE
jgi:hypothetical protein